MSQTDADIETVREAIRHTGYALVDGSWPAFERIVAELQHLRAKVESLDEENLELRMGEDL